MILPQLKIGEIDNLKSMKQLSRSDVVSFQLVCPDGEGVASHVNKGSEFAETTRLMLNKSKPGDIVTFEKIVTVANGKETKRPGLMSGISQ